MAFLSYKLLNCFGFKTFLYYVLMETYVASSFQSRDFGKNLTFKMFDDNEGRQTQESLVSG